MAISAGLKTALATGGYVAEYFGETYDRAGVKTATLEIIGGSIASSWLDSIRRTCEVTVPLDGWAGDSSSFGGMLPVSEFSVGRRNFEEGQYGSGLYGMTVEKRAAVISVLSPLRTRLRLYGKYTFGTTVETVELGRFTISGVSFTEDQSGFTAVVSGWDTSGDISLRRFESAKSYTDTSTLGAAITDVLNDYLPEGVSIDVPSTSDTTAVVTYLPGDGKSPWDAARELALTAAWNLTVNRQGNIVKENIPKTAGEYPAPSWTISDATTISSQGLSPYSQQVVNQVIVLGESAAGDPAIGVANDYYGPFGTITTGMIVSREERSEVCKTSGQCVNMASALLRKWGVRSESYTAETVLNPDLEPGQTVTVKSIGIGLDSVNLIVESIEFPLSAKSFMSIAASRAV